MRLKLNLGPGERPPTDSDRAPDPCPLPALADFRADAPPVIYSARWVPIPSSLRSSGLLAVRRFFGQIS
jgi:hypothetical protein